VSRRPFRTAFAIVAGTLLVAGVVAAFYVAKALNYPEQEHRGSGRSIPVEIAAGSSFPAIAETLYRAGVIDKPRWFRLYAMNQGATTKVRAGSYELRDDMAPRDVLAALLEGVKDVTVAVTVPEGLNMLEVFALFDKAGITPAAELETLARDNGYLASHGIESETCEGYLFPETYRFRAPSAAKVVLDRMIEQHRIVWDRVRRHHRDAVERLKSRLGWTDREILILASIVEKEAVVDVERPRIAQVFINRLTSPDFKPKLLETDPTIRYGCTVPIQKSAACQKWKGTDRLRRAQLDDVDNPYNTYRHEGLPPGPIGNPGRASLEAAVNPDRSKFLFFVGRNDGTHIFSRTYAEHTRWVNKYQR
jgi:UPF0755 protein